MFSLLTNITQLGDIVPEVPLPVSHNLLAPTLLSTNQVKGITNNTDTLARVSQMMQETSIDYIKLKPTSAQLQPSPSPLLHGIISQKASSLNNILAQQQQQQQQQHQQQYQQPQKQHHIQQVQTQPILQQQQPIVPGLPVARVEIKAPVKQKTKEKTSTTGQEGASTAKGKPRPRHIKGEAKDTIDLEKCYGCAELYNFAELVEDLFSATDADDFGKENVAFSQHSGIMNDQGVISAQFLSKLRAEIALVTTSSSAAVSKVPVDVLSRLMSILEQQVQHGASTTLAINGPAENYPKIVASLEASLVVLSLMLVEDIPKSVFGEEFIEDMLATIKFQLFSNILAFHDSSFKTSKSESDGESKEDEEEPDKKKSKKESRQQKAISDHVRHVTGYISEILDKLHGLASTFVFTDAVILQLSNINLPIFFVEGVNSLQLGALNVVRAIFSRYPSHRALILEEVFENLAKLPKTKRNLRAYKLPTENKSIQMVSALVMQLVQSCTALPANTTEGKSDDDNENSYGAALICAKTFLYSFMKRCANKTQEDDYRPILENFITDILTTLNMPEWPSAEISSLPILLQILNACLVSNIAKKNDPANVLRLLSIDLLGLIGAKLRIEINSCDEPAADVPSAMAETPGEEDARCICNKGDFGSFMLDCDDCHKWFHGACVGIDAANPPKIWYCDSCQIKRQVGSHKKKAAKNDDPKDVSEASSTDVMKQIYLNYLTSKARTDPSIAFSRQFVLAQWCHYDQGKGEEVIEYYKSQWELPAKAANSSDVTVTRDGIMKIGRSLAAQRGQHKAFEAVLNNLLVVLAEPQRSCRTKAMRALTTIVEADSSILGYNRVQNSVKNRFLDESPAVRESTVDLVGRYVLSHPDLIPSYYDKIVDRISDKSVSVRKRVVKLLRDICFQQPNNAYINNISKALVGRINDEDTIKELVIKIFQEMWFSQKIVDEKSSSKMAVDILKIDVSNRVSQIMEVVNLIENDDWLVDLLEKLLEDKDKKQIAVCSKLCESLVEAILNSEAKKSAPNNSKTAVVSAVKGLHTFCKAYPPLLIPHAATLATYLQVTDRTNKEESTIALNIAKILAKTIPFMEHPDPNFLSQVESDLIVLIQTQGTPVVQSSVQCLCEIVNKITKKPNKMEDLVRKYYPLLEAAKANVPTKSIVHTIFTISLMCRYYDFEPKGIAADPTDTKPGSKMLLKPGQVVDSILEAFLVFSKHQDLEIGVRALHGIGCLCLRKPQLLASPKVKAVIDMALIDASSYRRKEAILRVLADMLEGEDAKARQSTSQETISKEKPTKGKSSKETAKEKSKEKEEISGFGLIGTTIQYFHEKILALLVDKDERVRSAAVNTTHSIVSHRLVIPIECVPNLIALEGDNSRVIADAAHKLLLLINDKHPSFLLNRIIEGVKRIFVFRKELYGTENDTRIATLAVIKIYDVIKNSRVNRNNFLTSLVKTLEYARSEEVDAALSRFICDIAAFLPYTTADEPMTIVTTIDKIVSIKTGHLLSTLKAAATSPPVLSSSPATASLKCDCTAANTIVFLLELKRFLITRYSLSARYKNLAPNEAPKGPLIDKLSNSDDINSLPDVHPFSPIFPFSVQGIQELYTKLKTIVKEDEADEFTFNISTSTSPTKTKRGKSAAAKKRKTAAGNPSKPKRKPKKLKLEGDDQVDDEDDDYTPNQS